MSQETTVAAEVHRRVQGLVEAGSRVTDAIRRVAEEMGRTVAATSSAYYAARRRSAAGSPLASPRKRGHRIDPASLYEEMLPLVEAGATPAQAARRFGDEDEVAAIAAGFEKWYGRQTGEPMGAASSAATLAQLEADNDRLRREIAGLRAAAARARAALEEIEGPNASGAGG